MSEDNSRSDLFAALLDSALALASERDLDRLLERLVAGARSLARARYAALGIYDQGGSIRRFVYAGMDAETVERIGAWPQGKGLLGELLTADGPLRLADIAADPRSCGFPSGHPHMQRFLGVPVARGENRYGNLYLTEKQGGGEFDEQDEDLVVALAAFAACAIESAELVQVEHTRAAARIEAVQADQRARFHRELLAAVIEAQEGERARVARDLHDEIGQALTSVLLGLRLLETSLGDIEDATRNRLVELRALATGALDDARRLAFDLRPTVLDDLGLAPALRRLAELVQHRSGLLVDLDLGDLDASARQGRAEETVVYRIVQESLTNAVRHARASSVSVTIAKVGDSLRVVIEDDGRGFDPVEVNSRALGLRGMQERAALVGGNVQVTSAPGRGTTVVLEVPRG